MSTVRRIRTLSALAIAVGLLAPSARAHAQEGLKVGTMAPTSAPLETLDGKIVNVSAYVGKRPVIWKLSGGASEVLKDARVIEAYLGKRAAKAAAGHTPVELMGGPAT